jgi:hypothetical protein
MFASDTTHQQSVEKTGRSVEKTGQSVEKTGSGMGRFFSTVRATVHNGNSTNGADAVSSRPQGNGRHPCRAFFVQGRL